MYSVVCDGAIIAQSGSDDIAIASGKIRHKLNAASPLTLQLLPTNPLRYTIQPRMSVVQILRNGTEIWRGQITEVTVDTYGTIECTGASDMSYLQDSLYAPFTFTGSAKNYIGQLLDNHNNKVGAGRAIYRGTVARHGLGVSITIEATQYRSTWALLSDLLDTYGGYMRLRTGDDGLRYLDWLDDSSVFNGQPVRWGYNLASVDIDTDASDIATCLIGEGDGELTATLRDTDAVAAYGQVWEYKKFDAADQAALSDAMEAYLAQRITPERSVAVKALDMSASDRTMQPFAVGDFVQVSSPPHTLDEWLVVSEITEDLTGQKLPELNLGRLWPTLSDSPTYTQRTNRWIQSLAGRTPAYIYAVDAAAVRAKDSTGSYAAARED